MRDALRLEMGEEYMAKGGDNVATSIPAFYALDMIKFGLERDMPDAIRLGERLLSENGSLNSAMPRDLAMEVKNYMLENPNKMYNEDTIRRSGPSTSSRVYHQAHMKSRNSDEATPIFSVDDPYWKEMLQKNHKREDQWRTPSMYAWDHKRYGVVGEVLDIKNIRDRYNTYFGNSSSR